MATEIPETMDTEIPEMPFNESKESLIKKIQNNKVAMRILFRIEDIIVRIIAGLIIAYLVDKTFAWTKD